MSDTNATIRLTPFVIAACLKVTGLDYWTSANGQYIQDDDLDDCDGSGYLRFEHIQGGHYIWALYDYWYGSGWLCDTSSTLFRGSKNGRSPDQTVAWEMYSYVDLTYSYISQPALKVTLCCK